MIIAVEEFTGYNAEDNNLIYDLVVSIRVLKTRTDAKSPIEVVAAGVTHILENALSSKWSGLSILGHPGAAAFEVNVDHVGGLIEATRDEIHDERDELLEAVSKERSENFKYQAKFATADALYKDMEAQLLTLTRQYNAVTADTEELKTALARSSDKYVTLNFALAAANDHLDIAKRSITGLRRERDTAMSAEAVLIAEVDNLQAELVLRSER